jgi:hypothetical protein
MDDPRILNFKRDLTDIVIPERFKQNREYNVMLSAGDGSSDYNGRSGLNLQTMPQFGWNVFCCIGSGGDSASKLKDNIKILQDKPELNVLICLIDLTSLDECEKFGVLFEGSVDKIDSHDQRWYLPEAICYKVLKTGGSCYVIHIDVENESKKHIRKIEELTVVEKSIVKQIGEERFFRQKEDIRDRMRKSLHDNNFMNEKWQCDREPVGPVFKCQKLLSRSTGIKIRNNKLRGGKNKSKKGRRSSRRRKSLINYK